MVGLPNTITGREALSVMVGAGLRVLKLLSPPNFVPEAFVAARR